MTFPYLPHDTIADALSLIFLALLVGVALNAIMQRRYVAATNAAGVALAIVGLGLDSTWLLALATLMCCAALVLMLHRVRR